MVVHSQVQLYLFKFKEMEDCYRSKKRLTGQMQKYGPDPSSWSELLSVCQQVCAWLLRVRKHNPGEHTVCLGRIIHKLCHKHIWLQELPCEGNEQGKSCDSQGVGVSIKTNEVSPWVCPGFCLRLGWVWHGSGQHPRLQDRAGRCSQEHLLLPLICPQCFRYLFSH